MRLERKSSRLSYKTKENTIIQEIGGVIENVMSILQYLTKKKKNVVMPAFIIFFLYASFVYGIKFIITKGGWGVT